MARVLTRGLMLAAFAAGSVLAVGCGPKEVRLPETGATLEGTVKYGTEPLQFALVIAAGTTSAQANIGEDGRYKMTNVPLGEVKIAVNTDAGRGDYMSKTMSGTYKGPDGKGANKAALKMIDIPKKYHDPEKSGLKTTVNAGANTFDIVVPK